MIGQFLTWVGAQDPCHVFFAFSIFLFALTGWSYSSLSRNGF
jgi:hypothetical protein